MANLVKWGTPSTVSTLINGDATTPTLKALANNGQKLGIEYDNETNKHQFASLELYWRAAATPATGATVELYLIPAFDATNYADGDDSVAPPYTALIGIYPIRLVTTQQRIVIRDVPLSPIKFKALAINKTGQAATSTDNENVLRMRLYNPEVQ
jgi:hypothetical protein